MLERKRNKIGDIFDSLNLYHPNIKFTPEQNLIKFLDTQTIKGNNKIKNLSFCQKVYVPSTLVLKSAIWI